MKILRLSLILISVFFIASCQRVLTVNFDANATFEIESQFVSRNQKITKPEIYQTGFSFNWYLEKEFINVWNFNYDLVQESMTLYLKRTAITFPLFFNDQGGIHNNPDSFTVEDEFELLPASKEGYDFLGWFLEAELINPITSIERGTIGMKILHAKYRQSDVRNEHGFFQITAKRAKEIMDNNSNTIILDVRYQHEFDAGRIENAILIPLPELDTRALSELKDLDVIILVYCRSGVRSIAASKILVELGFTNIFEFGGILDWPFGLVSD